jgi:hypothetical protein
MAIGKKTGGRQAGTPNRRTVEVQSRLQELGCDPIEGMALIAMDAANSPELRGRMFAELAQYVAPKRRAMDLSSDQAPRFKFQFGFAPRFAQGEDSAPQALVDDEVGQ